FQAADGIRCFHVTGVQTCALPISAGRLLAVVGLGPGTLGAPRPTGALAAAGLLVHRRPGAGLGFVLGNALGLVALLDVLGLALLLVGVFVLAASGHGGGSAGNCSLEAGRPARFAPADGRGGNRDPASAF